MATATAAPDRPPEDRLDGGVGVRIGPGLTLQLNFPDGRAYTWTPEPEGAAWLGNQLLGRALAVAQRGEQAAAELEAIAAGGAPEDA